MRTLIILFMLTIPFSMVNIGCQDIEIGYLITEYAGYSLDSLVINYELDATPPEEVSNPEYQMYLDMGFSPEEIAARLGLGYSWFRRMFKEYTGVSPAQYQLQQKLLRAKELLTSTPLTISEIAYSLHFENAGQFSTFFKKKEGVTPSEFRDRTH